MYVQEMNEKSLELKWQNLVISEPLTKILAHKDVKYPYDLITFSRLSLQKELLIDGVVKIELYPKYLKA